MATGGRRFSSSRRGRHAGAQNSLPPAHARAVTRCARSRSSGLLLLRWRCGCEATAPPGGAWLALCRRPSLRVAGSAQCVPKTRARRNACHGPGAMRAVRRLASAFRFLFRCVSLRRFASRVGLRRLASACLRPDLATIYLNVVRYRGRASDNSGQRSFLQLWAGVFLLGSEALLLRMTRWGVRRRLRLAAFPARPDPPVRGCCPRCTV